MKVCGVIFDRDGTLVVDVPYNGDPDAVEAVPGASEAVARLRERGIPIAIVSNQSGVGRGRLSIAQVEAVNRRVDELLGPFDAWFYCPHLPDDGCDCRKPKPKLILDAAAALGVPAECCVVIGDKASDVQAAQNAGARGIAVGENCDLLAAVEAALRTASED